MAVERVVGGSSLVEVIDRILDKGIVVDAWVRVSLVGIELVTVEARVVIASVDTYLRYADAISGTPQVSRPKGVEAPAQYEELAAEVAALRAQLAAPRTLQAEMQPVGAQKPGVRTRKTAILVDERRAEELPRGSRSKGRKAIELEATPV